MSFQKCYIMKVRKMIPTGRGGGMFSMTLVLLSALNTVHGQEFDRNTVGVAFSPYVKNWENGAVPYFNSYTVEDIMIMLRLLNQKFSSISTYGMGVASYNQGQPWDGTDSNCLIARAASRINSESGQKLISMNQGVYQVADDQLQRETDNAYSAIDEANSIFPGTVWGITFTNEYIVDVSTAQRVLDMIRQNKDRAHSKGLQIGTRSHICGVIYDSGELKDVFTEIIRESDYMMCNLYPAQKDVNDGTENAVEAVGNYYFYLRDGFRQINPNIEVIIGETGWPSEGKSFNDSPNTIENLRDYWIHMGNWASLHGIKVQMFEAIDEPWKSDQNNEDPNNPGGRYGAEGHYGWWRRTDNNDPNAYVDKVTGNRA